MYKVIIVDDEEIALERFDRIAKKDSRLEVVSKFLYSSDVIDYLKENEIDIAFLDIRMPDINGLALAEQISAIDLHLTIVFITAYDTYALKAFQAHAFGYLLKPFTERDLTMLIDSLDAKLLPRTNMSKSLSSNQAPLLKVTCFGTFACELSIQPFSNLTFRTSKTAELFALLLRYRGKPIAKESLLDMLFAEMDYERANQLFYVSCSYLRSTFSKAGLPQLLIRENESYRIDTSQIDCDYLKFCTFTDPLSEITSDSLLTAASLYSGEYLAGRYYEWAIDLRNYLEKEHRKIILTASKLLLAEFRSKDAEELLKNYLFQNPCEEEIVERLLHLYIDENKKTSALNLYREYESKCRTLLDCLPSPSIKSLVRTL